MSSAKPAIPASADLPLDHVPAQDAGRHAPPSIDPDAIARLANAFFQQPPVQPTSSASPFGPPVLTPSLPDAPAPSVVNTVAPYAPARSPYGPPDVPQTTIPSVIPTPNIPAPAAPTGLQSPTRPLGLDHIPQPGASPGSAGPAGASSDVDYSLIPRLLSTDMALVPPHHVSDFDDASAPGIQAPSDNLYFLQDRTLPATLPTAPTTLPYSSPHMPAVAPQPELGRADTPVAAPTAPALAEAAAPSPIEGFVIPSPSDADPHRLSDAASLATPPVGGEQFSSGFDSVPTPGQAGPAASDALYFVSHGGGHPGAAAPQAPEPASPGYAPELAAQSAETRQVFDPYRVKRDFPILQQHVHGKPLIWLDNAATTQKPQSVIDRLAHFYEYENSNIHRAAHALAARSTDAYEAAREKVRRFLKAPSVKDVIFVRGATEGINLVAQAWGRRNVQAGDEIVVSHLEHHANIVPWQMLCAEKGARLRVAPVDDRGQLILEEYEKLLNPRTRIVAMTQVSNALGTVTPVREITAMAHRHGACVLIDGAQSVSHMPVDVQSIDCDFFIFSGHKVFGPTGIGVVYGKNSVLEHMAPWQGGGNMIADVTFEKTIYQGPPERFEAGTGNIADAVGLGAAIDYVESIGMEVIARYEHDLLVYATEKMKMVPGLTFVGTAAEKASVLSFLLDGHSPMDVGKALDREGIAVRAGHHCAQPILRRFGLEATVRPSLAFYNTCADVDALVAALLKLQAGRAGL
ncbi:family 2A encapsulin nanocompartment cargo protein cysteine desulfurase [Methylocystis parvus]|uniref:Cysteine desulfurase n=1 Tax=Methylocystis parvus TaxID=134 RepID=A0A6B8LZB4_9HYPH|nr:family 2A encapsulin nanocompartment cargo protein cysteine desulfurase [Methylocystis parvus]QGM97767.1 SufS family cysteine desulfurase [Methylocystis parvus]WBK01929.1 SufS family cysteine desulfurase [Methylocystis parvus OBBP]